MKLLQGLSANQKKGLAFLFLFAGSIGGGYAGLFSSHVIDAYWGNFFLVNHNISIRSMEVTFILGGNAVGTIAGLWAAIGTLLPKSFLNK